MADWNTTKQLVLLYEISKDRKNNWEIRKWHVGMVFNMEKSWLSSGYSQKSHIE